MRLASKIRKTILMACVSLVAMNANAYPLVAGIVTGYLSAGTSVGQANEMFFFQITNQPGGGCNTTNRFAINSTNNNFKTLVASVMAAYTTQTPINVQWQSTCNTWPNSYDANYVCVGSIPC
jgi:hypothetical protein